MRKKVFSILLLLVVAFLFVGCKKKSLVKVKFFDEAKVLIKEVEQEKGSTIELIDGPEVEGHDFDGWYLDNKKIGNDYLVETDISLYAKYNKKSYTVEFYDGDQKLSTKTYKHGEKVLKDVLAPTREGHVFLGWVFEGEVYDFDTLVTKDLKLVTSYDVIKFVVTFKNLDGTTHNTITVDYNNVVPKQTPKNITGKEFAGWFLNGILFDFDTKIKENITLEAIYEPSFYDIIFYDEDGITVLETLKVEHGTMPTPKTPIKDDTKEYTYEFLKWDKEIVSATKDDSYKALFTKTPVEYTLTFIVDDVETKINYKFGETILIPEEFEKIGYSLNFDIGVPSTMPANDLTLTVVYIINQYTIDFNTDGGTEIPSITLDYDSNVAAPNNPEKVGYTFVSWDKVIPNKMPANDVTITAIWEINKYTIKFYNEDGITLLETLEVEYNKMPEPTVIPTKEATNEYQYEFVGWIPLLAVATKDESYVAKFEEELRKFMLTFVIVEEEIIEFYQYQETVIKPADPVREGYTFLGWDIEVPVKMPASDLTITAKWEANKYLITFYDEDGITVLEILEVKHDQMPKPETIPTKEATAEFKYEFNSWHPEIIPATKVTSYKAIYSITPVDYILTWVIDGIEIKDTIPFGTVIIPRPNPEKIGYKFTGWNPELPETMPANNISVTATFEEAFYTIIFYDDDGITILEELEVGHGKMPKPSIEPSKEDFEGTTYTFDSWTPTIEKATKDQTYRAVYKTISFIFNLTWIIDDEITHVAYKYLEEVIPLDEPVKDGHTFIGWSREIPEFMPKTNLKIAALFEKDDLTEMSFQALVLFLNKINLKLIDEGSFFISSKIRNYDETIYLDGLFDFDKDLNARVFDFNLQLQSKFEDVTINAAYDNNTLYALQADFYNLFKGKVVHSFDRYFIDIISQSTIGEYFTITNLNFILDTIFSEYLNTLNLENDITRGEVISFKSKGDEVVVRFNLNDKTSLDGFDFTGINELLQMMNSSLGKFDFTLELTFIDNNIESINIKVTSMDYYGDGVDYNIYLNKIDGFEIEILNLEEYDFVFEDDLLEVTYYDLDGSKTFIYSLNLFDELAYYIGYTKIIKEGYVFEGFYYDENYKNEIKSLNLNYIKDNKLDIYLKYSEMFDVDDIISSILEDEWLTYQINEEYLYFEAEDFVLVLSQYEEQVFFYNKVVDKVYILGNDGVFYLIDAKIPSLKDTFKVYDKTRVSQFISYYVSLHNGFIMNEDIIIILKEHNLGGAPYLYFELMEEEFITLEQALIELEYFTFSDEQSPIVYLDLDNELMAYHKDEIEKELLLTVYYENGFYKQLLLKDLIDKELIIGYYFIEDLLVIEVLEDFEFEFELSYYTGKTKYYLTNHYTLYTQEELLELEFEFGKFMSITKWIVNGRVEVLTIEEVLELEFGDEIVFLTYDLELVDFADFVDILYDQKGLVLYDDGFVFNLKDGIAYSYYNYYTILEEDGLYTFMSDRVEFGRINSQTLFQISDGYGILQYIYLQEAIEKMINSPNVEKRNNRYYCDEYSFRVGDDYFEVNMPHMWFYVNFTDEFELSIPNYYYIYEFRVVNNVDEEELFIKAQNTMVIGQIIQSYYKEGYAYNGITFDYANDLINVNFIPLIPFEELILEYQKQVLILKDYSSNQTIIVNEPKGQIIYIESYYGHLYLYDMDSGNIYISEKENEFYPTIEKDYLFESVIYLLNYHNTNPKLNWYQYDLGNGVYIHGLTGEVNIYGDYYHKEEGEIIEIDLDSITIFPDTIGHIEFYNYNGYSSLINFKEDHFEMYVHFNSGKSIWIDSYDLNRYDFTFTSKKTISFVVDGVEYIYENSGLPLYNTDFGKVFLVLGKGIFYIDDLDSLPQFIDGNMIANSFYFEKLGIDITSLEELYELANDFDSIFVYPIFKEASASELFEILKTYEYWYFGNEYYYHLETRTLIYWDGSWIKIDDDKILTVLKDDYMLVAHYLVYDEMDIGSYWNNRFLMNFINIIDALENELPSEDGPFNFRSSWGSLYLVFGDEEEWVEGRNYIDVNMIEPDLKYYFNYDISSNYQITDDVSYDFVIRFNDYRPYINFNYGLWFDMYVIEDGVVNYEKEANLTDNMYEYEYPYETSYIYIEFEMRTEEEAYYDFLNYNYWVLDNKYYYNLETKTFTNSWNGNWFQVNDDDDVLRAVTIHYEVLTNRLSFEIIKLIHGWDFEPEAMNFLTCLNDLETKAPGGDSSFDFYFGWRDYYLVLNGNHYKIVGLNSASYYMAEPKDEYYFNYDVQSNYYIEDDINYSFVIMFDTTLPYIEMSPLGKNYKIYAYENGVINYNKETELIDDKRYYEYPYETQYVYIEYDLRTLEDAYNDLFDYEYWRLGYSYLYHLETKRLVDTWDGSWIQMDDDGILTIVTSGYELKTHYLSYQFMHDRNTSFEMLFFTIINEFENGLPTEDSSFNFFYDWGGYRLSFDWYNYEISGENGSSFSMIELRDDYLFNYNVTSDYYVVDDLIYSFILKLDYYDYDIYFMPETNYELYLVEDGEVNYEVEVVFTLEDYLYPYLYEMKDFYLKTDTKPIEDLYEDLFDYEYWVIDYYYLYHLESKTLIDPYYQSWIRLEDDGMLTYVNEDYKITASYLSFKELKVGGNYLFMSLSYKFFLIADLLEESPSEDGPFNLVNKFHDYKLIFDEYEISINGYTGVAPDLFLEYDDYYCNYDVISNYYITDDVMFSFVLRFNNLRPYLYYEAGGYYYKMYQVKDGEINFDRLVFIFDDNQDFYPPYVMQYVYIDYFEYY